MMNGLRIGLDARMLGRQLTGVGRYIWGLLEPMAQTHPEVHFHLYSNTPIYAPPRHNLVTRVETKARFGPYWMNLQLPRRLAEDRIDVFWGTNGLVPCLPLSVPPCLVTVHDLADKFAPTSLQWHVLLNRRIFQRLSVLRAVDVVSVSKATAVDAERLYGRPILHVLQPQIDHRYRRVRASGDTDICARYSIPRRYLLCVGTLEPRKNIPMLIEALLGSDSTDAIPLVLVGARGWKDGPLNLLLAEAERRKLVYLLGFVPDHDLALLYRECHAFLMPSIYEGFGMPLLEAQMAGAPVVHGDNAAMTEAAGNLGLAVPTSINAWIDVLHEIERGCAPLCCRVDLPSANERELSASTMWSLIEAAAKHSPA